MDPLVASTKMSLKIDAGNVHHQIYIYCNQATILSSKTMNNSRIMLQDGWLREPNEEVMSNVLFRG